MLVLGIDGKLLKKLHTLCCH